MTSIYLKVITLCLLSAAPFVYTAWSGRKNHSLPYFIHRIYEGMKKSETFRKFFTLIVLMVMLVVEFVDFQASTSIAQMIQDSTLTTAETTQVIGIYATLMSRPYATLLASVICLSFFSFRAADWMLTRLHQQPKVFLGVAILAILIMFVSARYIIVSQVIFIILMAAYAYPHSFNNDNQHKNDEI